MPLPRAAGLDQATALALQHLEIADIRIAMQHLLDLYHQTVHVAPHVRMTDRQADPNPEGNGIIAAITPHKHKKPQGSNP
jgi:hypothetical protein